VQPEWIAAHVFVEVDAVYQAGRVGAGPSAEPGGVVAGAMVGKAGLLVALLAGVAVPFEADLGGAPAGLVRRGAIRVIVLI